MNRWTLMATILLGLLNCRSDDSIKPVHGEGLAGTWLLYETGYSPGAGYIVDKIPSKPAQTLTFTADGQVRAQGDQLKSYQSYTSFRTDTTNKIVQIHFSPNVSGYAGSQWITLKNDTLTLHPPCIEGCHSAFVRVE
ncbi:hypothetical protein [Spirosoma areae]